MKYIIYTTIAILVLCISVSSVFAQAGSNPSQNTFKNAFGTTKLCGGTTGILCVDEANGQNAKGTVITIANQLLGIMLIVAAIIVFFLFITAGFDYMNSQGDPKKIQTAGNKILYAAIGLGVIAIAPLFAGIMGQIIYGDWNAILQLKGLDPLQVKPGTP